jgi:phosphatidylserine/phosphatidylglycerophosphate/cardiolipin synthase-like enzyme
MKARLAVSTNADDALLQWTVDVLDDDVIGFAVQRRLTGNGRAKAVVAFLENYAPPGPASHQTGRHDPSDARPFRTFSWTDHEVDPRDGVSYRVIPVVAGAPQLREDAASAWSRSVTVGAKGSSPFTPSFNRGFVISQFMSRYLEQHYPDITDRVAALKQFKRDIGTDVENRIRAFLSGQVREAMLRLLDDVRRGKGQVFAALFELDDEELIAALEKLGARVHVVLANGSIPSEKGVPASESRKNDENKAARARLKKAGADVEDTNRFVSPGALAHNKFLVVMDAAGTATRAWTGSTNWSTTGLCTQLNNGLLINNAAIADLYLRQWHALRDAASGHPRSLSEANGTPGEVSGRGRVRTSVHFTRAQKRVDLAALAEIVSGAREGVLFLMFIPGASGVFADVKALMAAKPDLLVRGVVSDLPNGRADETTGRTTTVRVNVIGGPPEVSGARTYDVVQAQNMRFVAAGWAEETTRQQFKSAIGFAIIHSKVLVVDPFSDDPTVVTGSHNFSIAASEENDENFIVVRGDHALARAYAVNVESAWRHYAARAGKPYPKLSGIEYLRQLLADQQAQQSFWGL